MGAAANAVAGGFIAGMAGGGNPYGAAINAAAQVGTSAIQSALGGTATSGSGGFDLRSHLDGSGWSVATGGSTVTARDTGSAYTDTRTTPGAADGGLPFYMSGQPYGAGLDINTALMIGAALLAVVIIARRKG